MDTGRSHAKRRLCDLRVALMALEARGKLQQPYLEIVPIS